MVATQFLALLHQQAAEPDKVQQARLAGLAAAAAALGKTTVAALELLDRVSQEAGAA